jgi:hypothetical protein
VNKCVIEVSQLFYMSDYSSLIVEVTSWSLLKSEEESRYNGDFLKIFLSTGDYRWTRICS